MRIKYFGNFKDDNGDIRENTRVAVIYYKDSESDKFSEVFNALVKEGYRFSFATDNGDGLNEDWFEVMDRDDFENLKEIYLEVKKGEYVDPDSDCEPDTAEPAPEHETPAVTDKYEFDRVVCRCCKSCTRLSECDKVMTYDAFSNVTEEMECRCCDGEYTCCIGFTPKLNPKELAYINPDYASQECELCSECIHYPECKEKGTVVMQHDGLCMYSVCPSSVCCQNFTPELPF